MLKAISKINWHFNKTASSVAAALTIILILALGTPLPSWGQIQSSGAETAASGDKIKITADRVVVDNDARSAEFSGRVRATQGTTVITSNVLTIFYRPSAGSDTDVSQGGDALERIVASGDVKILFDDKVATSAMAEYRMDSRVLVLSGPDSRIVSANNSIAGSKITFYRTDERVIVEGQQGKRVEAEFYTKENGLK